MKQLLCLIISIVVAFAADCQTLKTDSGIKHWETDFSAGLNTDGYQFDLGIAFHLNDFVGIKTAIAIASEINPDDFWRDKNDYFYESKSAARFKFIPSLSLRTPRLFYYESAEFYLFAEPGMVISPGSKDSINARNICWDFRTGINMQLDTFLIFAGYGVSNFSLYSGHPQSYNNQPDNDNYITHSGFIGFGFKFGPAPKKIKNITPVDGLF